MRRWTDGPLLGATLGCMLVALAGCASPVVGAECRPGYTVCESECVDLESDLSAAARAVAMNTAMLASFDELRVPGRGKQKNGGWVDGLGEGGGDHL